MVLFSVAVAFSCGRAKTIQKRNVWTRIFLSGEKNLRFQTKTDTCGRGLKRKLRRFLVDTNRHKDTVENNKTLFLYKYNLNFCFSRVYLRITTLLFDI